VIVVAEIFSCGRWTIRRGPEVRPNRRMSGEMETPPASPLAKETPPAPIVFLPSDRSPWDWGWLFDSGTPVRNGMADPPPSEMNPPAVNASEPKKNHQAPANTEAIDAVFADFASSSETASSAGGPANAARPNQIIIFLSPAMVGGR
jgi:hypothetical protein